MAIGDVTNPKRVRTESNERVDTVDVDALSIVAREHLDAYARAVEATPRNVGSTTPTGLIFQGFKLTLNPTGGSDGKVRVQPALGVAFDSNGRMLIKESGVQADLTLPLGNSQIYAYYNEVSTDNSTRRAISVASPYMEGGRFMATKSTGTVSFYVRGGDQTSIVASDVVNGATTALCFLGVANNAAGVVTMTGYDSVNAPNGAFATNRVTSVAQPTLPASSASNGSVATMHGLINAALYMIGQVVWKGSTNLTPTAANNFGAYTAPAAGIDAMFDSQGELLFAAITRWRDWQRNVRLLVDHQGYPGGQISVKDDHWAVDMGTESIAPYVGVRAAGSPVTGSVATGSVVLGASGDAWLVPLPVPFGGIITSIVVWYTSGSSVNTFFGSLLVTNLATNTTPPAGSVSKTITTPAGVFTSFDVMQAPTTGHGPKLSRGTEKLTLNLDATTVTASTFITVYDVIVTWARLPTGWTYFGATTDLLAAGDVFVVSDPVPGLNQRNLQLVSASTASVVGSSTANSVNEVYVDADLAHSMDFTVRTGAVGAAMGVSANVQLVGGGRWGLQRRASDANWQLAMSDDTTDQWIDTGVAFAANTAYRIKLEYQGPNRNASGLSRARLWINGAPAATATATTTITAGAAGVSLSVSAATPSAGPFDVRFGRVHRAWNHLANGDSV